MAPKDHWFFINTDASSLGGVSPHDAWLEHGMAFTGGPQECGEWLARFAIGDTLLIWANGLGVVGVGQVLESWDGLAYHTPLVYRAPYQDTEYRLRVDWTLDLRMNPITRAEIGWNPLRAVQSVGQSRAGLEAIVAKRADPLRVWSAPRATPDAAAFADALQAIEGQINALQRRLLLAQYRLPERCGTTTLLAQAAGVPDPNAVNLHYGKLGRLVGEALGFRPLREDGTYRWWNVLSWCPQKDPAFFWQMQAPLARALEQLGWVELGDGAMAEEVSEALEDFLEGAVRRVNVNAYERDPKARRACIAHHGATCAACGFDFGEVYGTLGDGFIHVHHVRPVSTLGKDYRVNPTTDLVPVCPNCHWMLHRESPPLSVEALKVVLSKVASC